MSQRISCPYVFCSATVEVKWMQTDPHNPEAEQQMIPRHEIDHSWIKGDCPASLMWIPFSEQVVEMLTDRAVIDRAAIEQRIERENERGQQQRDETAREGGLFPLRPLYKRGPGKLPGRLGREPGPNSGVWNPPRPGDPEKPMPTDSGGQSLGRGQGRHVASTQELVGQITEANVMAGEAAGAAMQCVQTLQAAKASIQGAKSNIAAALDGSGAQTLTEYLALLEDAEGQIDQAVPALENVTSNLAAGMERGETMIGRILS